MSSSGCWKARWHEAIVEAKCVSGSGHRNSASETARQPSGFLVPAAGTEYRVSPSRRGDGKGGMT